MGLLRGKGRFPLAVAAAASVAVVGAVVIPRTLGFFDASTTNAGNSISSGTLHMTNSAPGAVVTVATATNGGFKPGDKECNQVTVTNSGTLPAQVELSEANASTNALAGALSIAVIEGATTYTPSTCAVTGGTSVYSGIFNAISPTKITGDASAGTGTAAGDWTAGKAYTFTVIVTLAGTGTAPALPTAVPSPNADNLLEGLTASADLVWYSTQSTVAVVSNT